MTTPHPRASLGLAVLLAVGLLLAGRMAGAQPLAGYDTMDTAIKAYMAEKNIPGFAACVANSRQVVWQKAFGYADLENKTPMGMDVLMNIGSVSKTFTATAAMQLWEQGMLDLEADIAQYLGFVVRNPGYPGQPITVFQLLTHTASIRDGKAYGESYACGDPVVTLAEWIHQYLVPQGRYYSPKESFHDWPPGTKRKYANVGYGLLGLVVEKVAKQPFHAYCKAHIFGPLGMGNTWWLLRAVDTSQHATPYVYITEDNRMAVMRKKSLFPSPGGFVVGSHAACCLYSFPNYPDGLVRTSVRELSYFLIAMMNGGEHNGHRILKKETVAKMLSLQIDGNTSQGLCWYRKSLKNTATPITLWGHNGGDPGIATNLYFHPDQKIGVITFQNQLTGGSFDMVRALYLAEDGR